MNQQLEPKRELNFLQTSSIIVGQVIGSGIFINVPIVAAIAGNPWMAVLIWFLGGLFWLPQILISAEMGSAYPNQGGPYYFIHKAGSPFLAFQYTWTAFLTSDTPTITIIGLLAADALTFFFPSFSNPLIARIFAAMLIISFTYIQFQSVKTGGNVQVVLTFAKLVPLLTVVVIGMFFFGSGNLSLENFLKNQEGQNISFTAILAGISATVWAYAGFLNVLYTAGEIKNPQKVLPKAMIGSVLFVMGAYILISLCTSAIVPFSTLIGIEEGKFVNPFAYMEGIADYAGGIFAVAVFVSMLGVMNSSVLTQPRLEYAMARDGLFFEAFGKLHPAHLTPYISMLIQSGAAILLLFLGNLNDLLGYFTLSYLIQNTIVYGSIFFLRRQSDYKPTFKAPKWFLMGVLSILFQLFIIWGTFEAFPIYGVLSSLGLIILGIPLYFYFHLNKNKQTS